MIQLIKILYLALPTNVIEYLGKMNILKPIRDKILRPNKIEAIIREDIIWNNKKFTFFAPIKMALKAKSKGIENKLLRTSLQLINSLNKTSPIVLDIGSNYGFISLALKTNLDNNAMIYAFEPHPKIYATFRQSIEYNKFNNILVYNNAVGNETREIKLNLYGKTSNILDISPNQYSKSINIGQLKMDDFLKKNGIIPDFIKIDVDGYELEVLKGLEETIKTFKPIMVVETNNESKVIDYLKINDYKMLDMDLKEFEKLPANIFCIPKT